MSKGPRAQSSATTLKINERRETALRMRLDGHTLTEIQDAVGIDRSNLSKFFRSYRKDIREELRVELFDQHASRLLELWRSAIALTRDFTPVLDSDGKVIMTPKFYPNGKPVLDAQNQLVMEPMRDKGVIAAGINQAGKVAAQIAALYGFNAPTKTQTALTAIEGAEPVTFQIVDATGTKPSEKDAQTLREVQEYLSTQAEAPVAHSTNIDSDADAMGVEPVQPDAEEAHPDSYLVIEGESFEVEDDPELAKLDAELAAAEAECVRADAELAAALEVTAQHSASPAPVTTQQGFTPPAEFRLNP